MYTYIYIYINCVYIILYIYICIHPISGDEPHSPWDHYQAGLLRQLSPHFMELSMRSGWGCHGGSPGVERCGKVAMGKTPSEKDSWWVFHISVKTGG